MSHTLSTPDLSFDPSVETPVVRLTGTDVHFDGRVPRHVLH